jgi:hexokinase
MPSISAHFAKGSDVQFIFDDIHRQFQLGPETLVELTEAFLDEFKVGLGDYNHPMAMMFVRCKSFDP